MIVGHLGVAAAVAAARPRISPWWVIPAAIAPDLLDVAYALGGFCNPYGLYSHTVPAALLLGAVLGGAAVLTGRRETGAAVLLLVLLHLPPDLLTGRKLYWPGGELHGLQLYQRPLLDFGAEALLLVAGWALLRRRSAWPRWMTGAWMLAGLLVLQGGVDAFVTSSLKPSGCVSVGQARP